MSVVFGAENVHCRILSQFGTALWVFLTPDSRFAIRIERPRRSRKGSKKKDRRRD